MVEKKYFNKGKRSNVYVGEYRGKKVAIKEEKENIVVKGVASNEAKWLKLLNKHGIGPRLIKLDKKRVICEFVEGVPIGVYLKGADKKRIKSILLIVLEQCRILDKLGINKLEMTNPYKHVIIGKEIKMIDFERCRKSKNPKNVTQFFQYIMSKKSHLDGKGVKFDRKKLIQLLKDYKEDFSEKRYKELRDFLSNL